MTDGLSPLPPPHHAAFMDNDDHRKTCCASFWGPFRPYFGGHPLYEATTSAYLPTFIVFLYRAVFATFLSATFIYFSVQKVYYMRFYSSWCHLGLAISLTFSAAITLVSLVSGSNKAYSTKPSRLAFISVLLFQTFASAALFLDIVYWVLIFDDDVPNFSQTAQHALNLAFVLLDIVFSMRMQFKLSHAAVFVIFTLSYLGFMWIYYAVTDDFVYDFADYRNKGNGLTVAYYFGTIAWGVVAALIMFVISRLSRLPCISLPRLVEDEDRKGNGDELGV